ncbi:hypothetical protein GcM3_071006 [Golovinomyces cichoracearum]|uniref:Uncharacterized protein n=1 Tax=Golovinomyces cichoracearum TaxID=62708 RepID=A0A420ISM3_9PEZI|nr:hypothetical protein GcM3_071006 [Golovinomyces cichoracearum]
MPPSLEGRYFLSGTIILARLSEILTSAASKNEAFFNEFYDRHDAATHNNTPESQSLTQRRTHIEAISVGINSPCLCHTHASRERSYEADKDLTITPSSSHDHRSDSHRGPHRALQVSRNTLSAIIYTVEEALRNPHPFTRDIIEETASMSDIIYSQPRSSEKRDENESYKASLATGIPSGMRAPREIMRDRTAREARRKADLEQRDLLERTRARDEDALLKQAQRNSDRRDTSNAIGRSNKTYDGVSSSSNRSSGTRFMNNSKQENPQKPCDEPPGHSYNQQLYRNDKNKPTVAGVDEVDEDWPVPKQLETPSNTTRIPCQLGTRPPAINSAPGIRSSFPHAFERWETLSAHWEGLTSFWIRRLEENSRETERDPLLQQLSRQVTDLSAAGANLFHAVVELQRLRASSERKFQRWFLETRAELERNQEIHATQERKLQAEVQARASIEAELAKQEKEKLGNEKKLDEMRRELQISKEEAKRAWDELGRREQEERARVTSLRDGLPTVISGVEVVPMISSRPKRSESIRNNEDRSERPDNGEDGGESDEIDNDSDSDAGESYDEASSRHDIPEPHRSPVSQISGAADRSSNKASSSDEKKAESNTGNIFYQQTEGTYLHSTEKISPEPAQKSYVSHRDEQEDGEKYEVERQNRLIVGRPDDKAGYISEVDTPLNAGPYENEMNRLAHYRQTSSVDYDRNNPAISSYLQSSGSYSEPGIVLDESIDYSGYARQGYGPDHEWSSVPRHHHPTRLSDVMEEDERSRTSTSQISRSRE